MGNNSVKPTPEAKALSLFLMAYKTINPKYKEESKRINKLYSMVKDGILSKDDYLKEIETRLGVHGGYDEVVEKTVKYYIDKTGVWTLEGEDKYCQDAKKVAEGILSK
ncbi:hypothetical protein N9242_06630 [Vicingaceae bacterium]|jgi:hypothetical protein|nr:hypothetical protein [Vicingaceae bacterium]